MLPPTRSRIVFVMALLCWSLVVPFAAAQTSYTFTHLTGSPGGNGDADGPASAVRFRVPSGVAIDGSGNVYVADSDNNTIRKITPAGTVTTLAGLAGSIGSSDGTGSAARFSIQELGNDFSVDSGPGGVATDSSGNVYVADSGNHTIRKITPAGVVTTLAGLAGSYGSSDGTGSGARFYNPTGVATDSSRNVYVADTYNSTIRKITPAGVVTTLAGSAGSLGSRDGTGSEARFRYPSGVATDSSGNVYVADTYNHTIRKITPAGVVSTPAGLAETIGSSNGTGSAARFAKPGGVAIDSSGNVYVADTYNYTIRKITPEGVVTTLAGLAASYGGNNGTGSAARFAFPRGVATDSSGNVYVADAYNNTIRKITSAGMVTTLDGLSRAGGSDGIGSAAQFYDSSGVATDSSGNVYVAVFDHTIRKITPEGVVTTLAGLAGNSGSSDGTGSEARFNGPGGVATDSSGNVYIADTSNHTIRKITPARVVTTLAGLAGTPGSTNGTGSAARFTNPRGVATDNNGNIYVADAGNNAIRKVTPAGVVTTLAAGCCGVATDSGGNVYVADNNSSTIRKITPAGVVTTLAGSARSYGSSDGTGSAAQFRYPSGVATDSSGNVYVADAGNSTIRKITPAGVVTTVGGLAGSSGDADGTASTARFAYPSGVAIDNSSGTIYLADTGNHAIRIGRPALADVATIDAATGPVGTLRQLGETPQTATSFEWVLVRRPSASNASLSSTTIANPTFTPDVADTYIFQLTATNGTNTSITLVSLQATPAAVPTACSTAPKNVSVVFSGQTSGCTQNNGKGCSAQEAILFTTVSPTYAFSTCDRFSWSFGDGTLIETTGPSTSHQFAAGVPRTVTLTVTNPSGSATTSAQDVPPPTATSCIPSISQACLSSGRYAVTLDALTRDMKTFATGQVTTQTDLVGYFSLPVFTSQPENPEVFVKVIGPIKGVPWVFYSGLTDVEYFINVLDTQTGQLRQYHVPPAADPTRSKGDFDVAGNNSSACNAVTRTTTTGSPGVCTPDANTLCLLNRFKLTVAGRDDPARTGKTATGVATPVSGKPFGFFSFPALTSDPTNLEVFVKMLDATRVEGHFWLFLGGLTDLEFTITVTDTTTGKTQTYLKPLNSTCGLNDTSAFP